MAESKAGTITDHAAAFEWATVLTQSTVSASATRNLARAYIEQTKNIAALERSLAKLTAIEGAEAVPVGWVCEDGTPALKGSRPLEPGTNLYAHPVPIAPGSVSVPLEPTLPMLLAARDWSNEKYGKPIGNHDATGCYKAMLAAYKAASDEPEQDK